MAWMSILTKKINFRGERMELVEIKQDLIKISNRIDEFRGSL